MTTVAYVTKKGMFDAVGMDALGYADPKNDRILLRKGLDKKTEKQVRKHEFDHIQKGEEGPFSFGSLVGPALGLAGSLLSSDKQSDSAERAAELAQYNPYNISSGIGSGTFDGQSGSVNLSPQYQSQRDYYLNQSGLFNSQLNDFFAPTRDQFISGYTGGPSKTLDQIKQELIASGQYSGGLSPQKFDLSQHNLSPSGNKQIQGVLNKVRSNIFSGVGNNDLDAEAMRLFNAQGGRSPIYDDDAYNEAKSNWVSPEQVIANRLFKLSEGNESLARSSLENRLFSQGMLGSTGGAHRTNALLDAQHQAQLGREQLATTLAQDIQNQIQRRGINATQTALGIDQSGLDNLRLGASVGSAQSAAGANAAGFINTAGQNNSDAIAAAFSSFGNNLPDGLFNTSNQQLVPSTGGFGVSNKDYGSTFR